MRETVIKRCERHGDTEFAMYMSKSVIRYRCKQCQTDGTQRRRDKVKLLAIEYMGGKCSKCGYNKCAWALDFHHLDPKTKEFAISSNGNTRGFDKVKQELDKCVLLCANCHREEHYNQTKRDYAIQLKTIQCLTCKTNFECSIKIHRKYCSNECLNFGKDQNKIKRHYNKIDNNVHYCQCGNKKNYRSKVCKICHAHADKKSIRKVERPNKTTLINDLINSNFIQVGKKYNVRDNSIRKWCKHYGLPTNIKLLKIWIDNNK